MKRGLSIFWIALALACFFGASRLNAPLLELRKSHHISQSDPLDNAPPLVTFTTVALGGFRGILADILWMRAADLQEKGKVFELVQLADWITKLEPRYAEVWTYHGWNLAYNVSVLFNEPADRWRWVRHGIGLLRDEGLRYNPGNADMLYQLGWIYQHKIGQDLDDANKFYKQSWASEMMRLFDGPAPDYSALAAAPATREAFLQTPGAADLVRGIEAAGFDPYSAELLGSNLPPAVATALEGSPATTDLKAYVRRRALAEVYKLDPAIMQEVDAAYGPLDWRLSQAHAIYWAWRSRKVGKGFAIVQADRMIFQSLFEAFRQGRLFVSPKTGQFLPSPNVDLAPRVRKAYEDALAAHADNETIRTAHKNFLREAVEMLYTFHRTREAQEMLTDLQTRYADEENKGTLEEFVFRKLLEDGSVDLKAVTGNDALQMIESHFHQAAIWSLAGDPERAAGFEARAIAYYREFRKNHEDPDWWGRVGVPEPAEIRASARARAQQDFDAMQAQRPR